jgi:long-chain acyl-CoA synthetase
MSRAPFRTSRRESVRHVGSEGVLSAETLPQMFQARVRASGNCEAYRQFDTTTNIWIGYSWQQVALRVQRWRAALRQEPQQQGARVAILLPNGLDHVCADLASLSEGLVPVPLHVVDNAENLAFVVADCGASLLFVESAERWEALRPHREHMAELRRVVCLGSAVPPADGGLAVGVDAWLGQAGESRSDEPDPVIQPGDLAAIVYTSGTTGRPKGVMLSHRNVIANVRAIMSVMRVQQSDLFLSFLPLSHTFERTVGYYLPMAAGGTVAYARSVPLLMEDSSTIGPTILVSVPRIYERAHAALREGVRASPLKARLLDLAIETGWRRFCERQGRSPRSTLVDRLLFPVLDRAVGRAVRNRFGGRLRAAVTGGAPMAVEVARPFLALGVPLLQGYGMTESSPVVACNVPDDNDPESVGRALPGVSVRLGDHDELQTRSDSVMLGYWKRPAETAAALDSDGWLHTGDQARFVDGRIRIAGRLKDIIVTSTGEKVAPVDLETALMGDPLFDQAMVVGERRPYLAALLVVNRSRWERLASSIGLNGADPAQLRSPAAVSWALERVRQVLKGFPSYATPRAVLLTTDAWTVSGGLITPTLKPKRAAIEARYAPQIAELYQGH